ncbi:CocE/NonD family hydrolase [Streptomyces sp. NPDC048272]|uniref:CocE/NonD family hydrolase n=1 Tax=Streptomyces sp. NPDC048272 TaxID=3154616 RepID=UPI0034387892
MLRPNISVYRPEPGRVRIENNRPVVTRDGTVLRVNVYRPPDDTPVPVILFAHPYGKDGGTGLPRAASTS